MPNVTKDVKYLNKDFSQLRNNLIEFAKQYYPDTHKDFNEASPGMMFIEMASYVGDVMSYYIDAQFKESLLGYSEELRTLYSMAQTFGYKPRLSAPSSVNLEVFQLVPAKGSGNNVEPDYDYTLNIPVGTRILSTNGTSFRTTQACNFKYDSIRSPRTTEIFERDTNTQTPTFYLLKKNVHAKSGDVTSENFTFTEAKKYSRIKLSNQNVIEIISVTDSDNNKWYEVDSLAQDTVFDETENTSDNDPTLSQHSSEVPFLLKLKRVSKRFSTFRRPDARMELRFGAGVSDSHDEEIIPNPDNIGSNLSDSPTKLFESFDPTNFLKTKTYGQAPSDTTLTVEYSYGGGAQDNVPSGDITNITAITFEIDRTNLNKSVLELVQNSVAISNKEAATGGLGAETPEELRENIKAYFQSQGRAVTKEDYIVRTYSLPDKYGNIAKAYIVQDDVLSENEEETIPNPLALNLYVLGYDSNKFLTSVNDAVKENLKNYLIRFRPITDAVNIKNGYVINIGVNYSIVTTSNANHQETLLKVNNLIANYFEIDRWQINQPIILSKLQSEILTIDGVASVTDLRITNKYKTIDGYSGNVYDIQSANKSGIVYPALDPSIFELKYPLKDIVGNVDGGENE
tara:strand:+ start:425 stop:2305 length:1881 start_codon:yes stop_codon:yes gene_type:complete